MASALKNTLHSAWTAIPRSSATFPRRHASGFLNKKRVTSHFTSPPKASTVFFLLAAVSTAVGICAVNHQYGCVVERYLPLGEIEQRAKIAKLFATKSPSVVLKYLHTQGYEKINECHCIPQFSRTPCFLKNIPDARAIAEKELVAMIKSKFPDKERTLAFCSIASGRTFQDLVLISKLQGEGYENIRWILVDPYYKTEEGKIIIQQFHQLARFISPKIDVETVHRLQNIESMGLVADVFFNMDDGFLDQISDSGYEDTVQSFEKYISSLSQPVIYLYSRNRFFNMDVDLWGRVESSQKRATVHLTHFSPQAMPESRILLDSTI